MKLTKLIFILLISFLTLSVQANQLLLMSAENAEKAAAYINKQKEIILYCACCNNDRALKVNVAEAAVETYQNLGTGVRLKGSDQDRNVIDQFVDLAQVWVKFKGVGVNLGKVMNLRCDPCASSLDWKTMKPNVHGKAKETSQDNNSTLYYQTKAPFKMIDSGQVIEVIEFSSSYDSVLQRLYFSYKLKKNGVSFYSYAVDVESIKRIKAKKGYIVLYAKRKKSFDLSSGVRNKSAGNKQLTKIKLNLPDGLPSKQLKKGIRTLKK